MEAPCPISILELRSTILARWRTLRDAFDAAGLSAKQDLDLQDLRRLVTTPLDEVSVNCNAPAGDENSCAVSRANVQRTLVGNENDAAGSKAKLQRLFRDLIVDCTGEAAPTGSTCGQRSKVLGDQNGDHPQHCDLKATPRLSTVPKSHVLALLGNTAPREGFRAWSTRVLLLGQDAFHGPAWLLNPESAAKSRTQPVTKKEFCEAAVLFNANFEEVAEWYDMMESSTGHARTGQLDYNCLQRRVLGRPRLEGPVDINEPLSTEEVAVRLLAIWGDLTSAFGLTNSTITADVAYTGARRRCPSPSEPRQALVTRRRSACSPQPHSPRATRRGWRPSKNEWLRAVRGKLGRHYMEERDAQAESERLACLSEPIERLFPNVCDRLMVSRATWLPGEVVTVRYTLSEYGFWGAGMPHLNLPHVTEGSSNGPTTRRLALGARPFIGLTAATDAECYERQQDLACLGRIHAAAAVDPAVRIGTVFLRTPDIQVVGQGSKAAVHWQLRLFASSDGKVPLSVLSTPLAIQVQKTVPAPPISVTAHERGHDFLTLAWTPAANDGGAPVELYEVCVWDNANGDEGTDSQSIVWLSRTAHRVQRIFPLRHDSAYTARVRCVNCMGIGRWSASSKPLFTGPPLPGPLSAPSIISMSCTSAKLRWCPKEESLVTHYSAQVLPISTEEETTALGISVQVLPGLATEACIEGLLANTAYCFKVRAHNHSGAGPWSNASEAVCTNIGPPQPPGSVTVLQAMQDRFKVTWQYPANHGGADVTGFVVNAQGVSASGRIDAVEASALAPPAWLCGLKGNTWYNIRVASISSAGVGAFSLPSKPSRTAAVAPRPPKGVHASCTNAASASISWDPPDDDGGAPVLRYRVVATPTPPLQAVEVTVGQDPDGTSAAATTASLPPLRALTEYWLAVFAETKAGSSPASKETSFRTSCTVPCAPSSAPEPFGELTQTSILLRWAPLAQDGGKKILGYEVLVGAADGGGMSARESDGVCLTGRSSVVRDTDGVCLTGRSSVVRRSSQPRQQRSVTTEGCALLVNQLEPNRTYYFALRARNSEGYGPRSRWSGPVKTLASPPLQPSRPRPWSVTARSVAVEWEPPVSDVPLLEYEVWSGVLGQDTREDGSSSAPKGGLLSHTTRTSMRITGLAQNTVYVFRVRAKNRSGWSPWSAASEACSTSDICSRGEIKASVLSHYGGTVASAFRAFDRDGDGTINRDDFVAGFVEAGLDKVVPLEQRLQLFAESDERHSGRLTYREFAKAFSPYKATPALTRQPVPELPFMDREEIVDEICHGRKTTSMLPQNSRLGRAVERLTTSRARLRRADSEAQISDWNGSACTSPRISPPQSPRKGVLSPTKGGAAKDGGGRHSALRLEQKQIRALSVELLTSRSCSSIELRPATDGV